MTEHHPAQHTGSAANFDALMAVVMVGSQRFGHREHVRLTWLAVRHWQARRHRSQQIQAPRPARRRAYLQLAG
jgi:hypothetical protein